MGGDFRITDLNGLLNYCNNLRSHSKSLNELLENLNNALSKIEGYWQNEEGEDKQSYIREVKTCMSYLMNISNSGLSFAESMETLQEKTVKTQNQSLEGADY